MPEWKVTQLIFLDLPGNNRYIFRYPAVIFPNRCAICGEKAMVTVPLVAQKSRSIRRESTISGVRDYMVLAYMEFKIPVCTHHDQEMKDYKILENQIAKESMIILALTVIACALLTQLFIFHGPIDAGSIIMSIFLGGGAGVFIGLLIGILIPVLVRVAQNKPYVVTGGGIKDFGLPSAMITYDFNNDKTWKLIFKFKNKQFYEDYLHLSNVEWHLLSAFADPDFSVSNPALDALVEAGFQGAVPTILCRFIEDIGKAIGICHVAANALERLEITQPVEEGIIKKLVDGLQADHTRDDVARVLVLCGEMYAVSALETTNPDIKIALLRALAKNKVGQAVPDIIPLLGDSGKSGMKSVSYEAASALKKIGTPEALEELRRWKEQH